MGFEGRDANDKTSHSVVVVDNSVVMRWLVATGKTKDQTYALAVREAAKSAQIYVLVPYLWVYEAAHVVSRYVGRGDLTHQQGSTMLLALEEFLTIVVSRESPDQLADFAHTHGLSAYDAAYVMLAAAKGAPLATLDIAMRRKATMLGLTLF